MNARRCLKIAKAIDALLAREMGEGIDAERMLSDALYARDVLLVCDAMREHELATLSPRFRRAMEAEPHPDDAPRPNKVSGFSASNFLSSLFGGNSTLEAAAEVPPAARRGWFGRSRNAANDKS
jgi:hypothetical protein